MFKASPEADADVIKARPPVAHARCVESLLRSSKVVDQLCSHGMAQAGQRMMKIAAMARQQFRDDWAFEREYLVLIFFNLWAGRGPLEEFSVRTSVRMQGSVSARQMRMQVNVLETLYLYKIFLWATPSNTSLGCNLGRVVNSSVLLQVPTFDF